MPASSELHNKVLQLSAPIFEELGLECVELTIGRKGKTVIFDFIADHVPEGLTMDECASLNKRIADKMEEDDIVPDDWVVQVASPGLDRPLKTLRDFQRVLGRKVSVQLKGKVQDKGLWRGKLIAAADNFIVIDADKGPQVKISVEQVVFGKQILLDEV